MSLFLLQFLRRVRLRLRLCINIGQRTKQERANMWVKFHRQTWRVLKMRCVSILACSASQPQTLQLHHALGRVESRANIGCTLKHANAFEPNGVIRRLEFGGAGMGNF